MFQCCCRTQRSTHLSVRTYAYNSFCGGLLAHTWVSRMLDDACLYANVSEHACVTSVKATLYCCPLSRSDLEAFPFDWLVVNRWQQSLVSVIQQIGVFQGGVLFDTQGFPFRFSHPYTIQCQVWKCPLSFLFCTDLFENMSLCFVCLIIVLQ